MPEGDVVWWYARRLHAALAGNVLTRSDFRVPRFATADLTGRIVTQVVSRGKHMVTRVEGGLIVHTHLRMDGSWRIRPAAEQVPASHRVRLILGNDTWAASGYQLGIVELLPTAQEDTATGHLGPDLLGPDWDLGEAVHRLGVAGDRAIAEALLDQRCLAGIGNLYKSEVLFLRGSTHGAPSARSTISSGSYRWRSGSSTRTRTGSARSPQACGGAARKRGCTAGPACPVAAAAHRCEGPLAAAPAASRMNVSPSGARDASASRYG